MIDPISASPAATSLAISQTYGFAPALLVPGALAAPVIHIAINPNPDVVPAVTEITRDNRLGHVVDNYA